MGLFDLFKKKKNEVEEEKDVAVEEVYEEEAIGWNAITSALEKVYPTQKTPKHYAPELSYRLGGDQVLDGISIYDGGDFWHFVSYGLTELYEKESTVKEYSGFGMEFTFKLKKDDFQDEEAELRGICNTMQTLAKLSFDQAMIFRPNESIYTGQTQGIDSNMRSKITGFITALDSSLGSMDTPHGKVDFVCLIGATDDELKAIQNKELSVEELLEKLGTDVTDYNRNSVI